MKPNASSHPSLRIAVPCYGGRVLPRFGQARDFYFAEVDLESKTVQGLQRRTWEPVCEPQVARWLRGQDTGGILCGGIHPRFQAALSAEGIWVAWGFRGEVRDILQQWVEKADPNDLQSFSQPPRQGCSQPFQRFWGCCSRKNNF